MYRLISVFAFVAIVNGASLLETEPHIIGGKAVNIGDHPYMVSLQLTVKGVARHVCGGAILSSKHILTGALCLRTRYPIISTLKDFKVQVGGTNIKKDGKLYEIAKSVSHPKFDPNDPHNDVAVLTLVTPIKFGPNARPIELVPVKQEPQAEEEVIASGWGATTNGTGAANNLHSVSLPIMDRNQCVRLHLCIFDCSRCRRMAVDRGLICAGGEGFNVRELDLGGPLVNNKTQIVGVTAYLHNCHPIVYPSIAVNVAEQGVHDFITANMK